MTENLVGAHFLLYIGFVMVFSLLTGMIVNLAV